MNFDDDMFKYLGLVIILAGVLFVANKCFNTQQKIVEGLTDMASAQPEKFVDDVRGKNEDIENSILLDKYRSHYEDLLIQQNHNINLQILKNLIDHSKVLSEGGEDSQPVMDHIQKLHAQKAILNNTMEFMDGTTKNIFG
jgi:hypothetical protein